MENRRIKTEQYKRSSVATNAYAFASTFAFSPTQQPTQKKAKELASQHTGHRRQLCKLDTTTLRTDRRATDNMGLKEMAGEVVNQTFVHLINNCGRLTVRASKPPLL